LRVAHGTLHAAKRDYALRKSEARTRSRNCSGVSVGGAGVFGANASIRPTRVRILNVAQPRGSKFDMYGVELLPYH
jgi:hypothetical protein